MGRGNESLSLHLGNMTRMATTPIYGKKPFKNILLQNQRANGFRAWYAALHGDMGPIKFEENDKLGLTLTFFYEKVKCFS